MLCIRMNDIYAHYAQISYINGIRGKGAVVAAVILLLLHLKKARLNNNSIILYNVHI